jgi:HD-GYP domain-containing protein (c-di-GMP phosphodiesterase class II)
MKQGVLDPDELVVMRRHAEGGFEILRKAPLSDAVKLAVRHSHERWDGAGYPEGLVGEAIPLIARVVSVVDAYEAMTSDRPYRKAMPVSEALDRIRRGAGSQFDPRVVEIFAGLIHQATTTSGRWRNKANHRAGCATT